MTMRHEQQGQEELFINQAAHVLLALAGIKALPKNTKKKDVPALDSLEFDPS